MSEFSTRLPTSPKKYMDFVESSILDVGEHWEASYAPWIASEKLELLSQHGPGVLYLQPPSFNIDTDSLDERYPKLKEHMLDELGDMIWFGFAVISKCGLDLASSCDDTSDDTSFKSLTDNAVAQASLTRVPNKVGFVYPDAPEQLKTTSIADNPSYVLQRTVSRVCRSLNVGSRYSTMPIAMSDLEPVMDIAETIGAYLNSLFYVGSVCLRGSVESVVDVNMAKIRHRKVFGK